MSNKGQRSDLKSGIMIDQSSFFNAENHNELLATELMHYLTSVYRYAEQIALATINTIPKSETAKSIPTPTNKVTSPPTYRLPKSANLPKIKAPKRDIFAELFEFTVQSYAQTTYELLTDLIVTQNLNIRFDDLILKKCDRRELTQVIDQSYSALKAEQINLYIEREIENSRAALLKKIKDRYIRQFVADCKLVDFASLERRATEQFRINKQAHTQSLADKENMPAQSSKEPKYESKVLKQASNYLGLHSSGNSFALLQIDLSNKNLRHLRSLREGSTQYRSVICKNNKLGK